MILWYKIRSGMVFQSWAIYTCVITSQRSIRIAMTFRFDVVIFDSTLFSKFLKLNFYERHNSLKLLHLKKKKTYFKDDKTNS